MTVTDPDSEPPIPGTKRIWLLVIALLLIGAGTFTWAWLHWGGMAERAQFGDLLSGVAGAVAFAGMAAALVLQTLELREQRKELRLTRAEMRENREETKAQTDQFKAQAAIMEEQVKVTRLQNELLERQLMLDHLPMLRMFWESVEGGAALVIENEGHGQALVQELRFKGGNWSGPSKETFMTQLANHSRQPPVKVDVEFKDVDRGTLIDPHARAVVLVVKAPTKNLVNFGGFGIHVAYVPAQGGEQANLTTTVEDIRKLDA